MSFVPGNRTERDELLREVGIHSFDELLAAVPAHLRLKGDLRLPTAKSEWEVLRYLTELSARNATSETHDTYLGGGFYDHYSPAVVDFIASRPEFATAYTPYQPEVSQGTLQSIYEFQTMIARLTAMDVVNASMYDGASATAEAVLLSLAHTRKQRVLCASGVNPLYTEVVRTYTSGVKPEIVDIPETDGLIDRGELQKLLSVPAACVVVQSPNFFGAIEDIDGLKTLIGDALLICITNPMSLGILKPPGEYGVDICVGEAQPLGNAISYGGPGVGIFAAKSDYMRKLPGRLVARTADIDGRTGYVLTLQTREQHIRREKATSNICTNQALCALAAGVYMSLLGKAGIVEVGDLCTQNAHYLASEISKLRGFELRYKGSFFNEFVVRTPVDAVRILKSLEKKRILAGIPLEWFYPERNRELLIAVTEKRRRSDLDRFVAALAAEAA